MPVVAVRPNSGIIELNPNFLETSGGYEFINLMKHAQLWWVLGDNSGPLAVMNADSNGYPTTLTVGSVYTVLFLPPQSERAGNYVITWTGNGTVTPLISTGTFITLISGSYTGSGGSGRAVFATDCTEIRVSISALPVSNLAIFFAGDEADFNAGYITGKQFRFRIQQAQIPVFRNLNWGGSGFGGANVTNQTNWASRKPVGYVSYAGGEMRSSIYAGSTSTSNDKDYSITFGSGGPTDKLTITALYNANATNQSDSTGSVTITNGTPSTINWTSHGLSANDPFGFGGFLGLVLPSPLNAAANYYVKTVIDANSFTFSATPGGAAINTIGTSSGITIARLNTLNLNGTGAIPIRDQFGQIQFPGANNQPVATFIVTFVYDAALGYYYTTGGNSNLGHSGLENGVPPEVFVQVCNEIGCHPWFVSPYLACDPMTDWHIQLATYCKNNCASWAIPRFECLNEPWNSVAPAGVYPTFKAFANWAGTYVGGNPEFAFIGKIASTIGQDINSVYGGQPDGTKYHVIVNCQTFGSTTPNELLNAATYVGQSAPAQAGYTKTPAHNWITHICNAQYFGTDGTQTSSARTSWMAAAGNPTLQQSIVDTYLDDPTHGIPPNLNTLHTIYQSFLSWCSGFTNNAGVAIKMCGYEGGFSTTNDDFGHATKFGTNMQTYYVTNINNFLAAGGRFPAEFQLSSSVDDSWSVLQDIYESPDPPQWVAMLSFALPPTTPPPQPSNVVNTAAGLAADISPYIR